MNAEMIMEDNSKLKVEKIKRGIVLDHIAAGNGMPIFHYLHLENLDCSVVLIKNVASRKMGKKDMIKIEDELNIDMDSLGYIDPNITVIKVEDGNITSKQKLTLPRSLTNVIFCKNPRCITSIEQEIIHIFDLSDDKSRTYRCRYCEQESK